MRECIVIGAGIIGCTVAEALRKQLHDINRQKVMVIDAHYPMSGTKPSGGHLKPSWFGGMSKEEYEPAMELLDDVWGLHTHEFLMYSSVASVGQAKVFRVDTDKVYTKHSLGVVLNIDNLGSNPVVSYRTERGILKEECKLLVVATGASDLINGVDLELTAKQGVSFRMPGRLPQGFIFPWAPYKQVVAHQQAPDQIWVGDGSAIKPDNWTEQRTRDCLSRCNKALGKRLVRYRNSPPIATETRMGYRAYCEHPKNEPCLFKQLGPNAFVATGAGKSGTISAGWVARKILQHIGAV